MSAIPLVNLIPQGQTNNSAGLVSNSGQNQPADGSFGALITQAGAVANGHPAVTGVTDPTQAPSHAMQESAGDFSDLLRLLDLFFGFLGNSQDKGMKASNQQVQASDASQENQAGQVQTEPSNTPKAFEGFLSEIQKMLFMFQAIMQQFQAGMVAASEQPATQTSAGEPSVPTGQQQTAPLPASADPDSSSPVSETVRATPEITPNHGPEITQPNVATTPMPQAAGDTLPQSGTAPGPQETSAVIQAEPQQEPPGQIADDQFPSNGNFEFYSLSYRGTWDGNGPRPEGINLSPTAISMEGINPVPGSQPEADSPENILQMNMRQTVVSAVSKSEPDTYLNFLSGSMQIEADGESHRSLHVERLNMTTDKGSLNAYVMQISTDAPEATQAQHGTSSDNQNTIVINYQGMNISPHTADDYGQADQHNSPQHNDDLHIVFQNSPQNTPQVTGTETGSTQPSTAEGENVAVQLADGISQAVKMNRSRAILHLNPPELGTVKVNITLGHNNHVQANFITDHPDTRHIIEANLQNLRDNLAQSGFSLGQVNVDLGGNAYANSGGDPQGHHLTPFGDPEMWLNNNNENVAPESLGQGISQDGVHVII